MFDPARAARAVNFIQCMRQTKGIWSSVPLQLMDWQRKIIEEVFGTVKADGTRQYRTVYISVARKNGKSTLAAAIALYLLFGDEEPGAEIYSAAADREQASIVYAEARGMIANSRSLGKRCKIVDSTKRIIHNNGSWYRVLSADHATKHGLNAHGIIFDELHAQPNRMLWDVLTTSGGARSQPLTVAITTAGYDRTSICYEVHEYAKKIRDKKIEDPTFYPAIFETDPELDWTDEANWGASNPALGTFRTIEDMRIMAARARQVPALQNTFRRLYLNQWTQQSERWIDYQAWMDSAGVVGELDGRPCWAGMDLASTGDLAAVVLVFPVEDHYEVIPRFWLPAEAIEQRSIRDGVPYDDWHKRGLVIATPGRVIDYRMIRAELQTLAERYQINEIRYDRYNASEIVQNLGDDGFTLVPMGQGVLSMNNPLKELLRLVLERKLWHGNHPVLNWCADNMAVKSDTGGNIKPDRKASTEKIDGMVALLMALDAAIAAQNKSVYEDQGITFL